MTAAIKGEVVPSSERAGAPAPRTRLLGSLLPPAVAVAVTVLLLLVDRLPRFFHDDLTAYLATGPLDWDTPGRSWAYGHAARLLTAATGSPAAVPAAQAGLLLAAILLACRFLARVPGRRYGLPLFALAATLDPLGQVYARFWLTDTVAAAAFFAFMTLLAAGIAASPARFWRTAPWLVALAAVAVAGRADYAVLGAAALLLAATAALLIPARHRMPRLRRRLLATAALPAMMLAAQTMLSAAVSGASSSGASSIQQFNVPDAIGSFLPALRRDDFMRAGILLTRTEFERLDLSNPVRQATRLQEDGPESLRRLMGARLGMTSTDGPDAEHQIQTAYSAMLRSGLRDHPQTFAATYLRGFERIFEPTRWREGVVRDLDLGHTLSPWVTSRLAALTGRTPPPKVAAQDSRLSRALLAMASIYPALLIAGGLAALAVLLSGQPGPRLLPAAALVTLLLAAPFAGADLHPRYFLAGVTAALQLLTLTLLDRSTYATASRLTRRLAAAARTAAASPALPAAVAVLCIAAYAGQLGLARWQTDEYTLFANQRTGGWDAFAARLQYAPRPFSEGLLSLYGAAVNGSGRPLVVPFLLLLWAGVMAMAGLAAWMALPRSPARLPTACALAVVPFAFVLATNEVTEAFYWPMAAAAYLPVAGAATVLLVLLSRPMDALARGGCCAALLVAAGSSEVGAALAVGFAVAALAEAATRPARQRGAGLLRDGAWWLAPGLLGIAVLLAIVRSRANVVELGADTQPYTGRLLPSLGLTAWQFALDLVGADGDKTPAAVLGALAAKLALAAGLAGLWHGACSVRAALGRQRAVLAASFAAAAAFSILAAYYHYGALCCERQATTRHWMLDLLLVVGAGWTLGRWPAPGRWLGRCPWLAPVLLSLSLLPVLGRVEGLLRGYDVLTLSQKGGARTWRSGTQSGPGQMEFYLPPERQDMLVRGTFQPVGTYPVGPGAGPKTPEMIRELGRFFGKQVVHVCQPWQEAKSRLLNGQFIPACPPHDGPPDVIYPSP